MIVEFPWPAPGINRLTVETSENDTCKITISQNGEPNLFLWIEPHTARLTANAILEASAELIEKQRRRLPA